MRTHDPTRPSPPGPVLNRLPGLCGGLVVVTLIVLAAVVSHQEAGLPGALVALASCFAILGVIAWGVREWKLRPRPMIQPAPLAAALPPPAVQGPPPAPPRTPESPDDPTTSKADLGPWVRIGLELLPVALAVVAIVGPRRSAKFAARGYSIWKSLHDVEEEQEKVVQEV